MVEIFDSFIHQTHISQMSSKVPGAVKNFRKIPKSHPFRTFHFISLYFAKGFLKKDKY